MSENMYPEGREGQNFQDEKNGPSDGSSYLTHPEETCVDRVWMKLFVVARKFPYFFPILIEIIPPSKSNQKSSCDIFDSPKVQSAQNNDNDEGVDIIKKVANDKISKFKL